MKRKDIIIVGVVLFSLGLSALAFWGMYDVRNRNISTPNQPPVISYETSFPMGAVPGPDGSWQVNQIIRSYPPSLPPMSITEGIPTPSFLSATTSLFISRGGATDTSKLSTSDVIIAYIGDSLMYYNTTMGFEFGLPSSNKMLRLDDTGIYSRRSDAVLWLWFTKNFDIAIANFFVTPTNASSLETFSFDYNFSGYPKYEGTLSSVTTTVSNQPALEETVSYESISPGYPNIWKFVHIIHGANLYTFGVQIGPSQTVNVEEALRMILAFKNSFHFLQ